jgi:hypothetical protein
MIMFSIILVQAAQNDGANRKLNCYIRNNYNHVELYLPIQSLHSPDLPEYIVDIRVCDTQSAQNLIESGTTIQLCD